MTEFHQLGLDPKLLATIKAAGYDRPTPIQVQAIPPVLEGRDVMGLAQTGTGKTAAFGLPLIHRLLAHPGRPAPKSVKALVLAPTRELVNQIADNLATYVQGTPMKVRVVVGGASINRQMQFLDRGSDILVATPGRLIDLMDRRAVRLDSARLLVLDEADQMLDMGFIHALRRIAPALGRPRQTMLFSATMPKQMAEISAAYLENPVRIEAARVGRPADRITQSVHWAEGRADKLRLLKEHLRAAPDGLALVFGRTKHGSEKLMKDLVRDGFNAVSIHGNKRQGQRERALRAFRAGEARILVATDVAARGIDIPGVSHVYNFDLPEVAESYVHRIGRTARAGADGDAVSFVAGTEIGLLRQIEKMLKTAIPVIGGDRPQEEAPPKRGQRGNGGGRNRRPANSPASPQARRRRRPRRKPAA